MNWEFAAAVSQVVSAIGVIVSLIYLAIQIGNHNKEVRLSTINALTEQWNSYMTSFVQADVGELWIKALRDFENLTTPETARFGAIIGSLFRIAEGLYLHHLDGKLDPRIWRGISNTIADMLPYPGIQSWWNRRKHWYSEEFASHIDQKLRAQQGSSPRMYPSEQQTAER